MAKGQEIRSALLRAFDESDAKTVSDVCRRTNIERATFYHHFRKHPDFRREVVKKQIAEKMKLV